MILLPHYSQHEVNYIVMLPDTQDVLLLLETLKDLKTRLFSLWQTEQNILDKTVFCYFFIILPVHYDLLNIYSPRHGVSKKKILQGHVHKPMLLLFGH